MWVFQGAASGTQPAASGAPVMRTLEAIRAEVGDAFVTLYIHTVVNGSRSVRIAPSDKRVVWHATFLQSVEADISAFDMSSLGRLASSWPLAATRAASWPLAASACSTHRGESEPADCKPVVSFPQEGPDVEDGNHCRVVNWPLAVCTGISEWLDAASGAVALPRMP